MRSVLAVVVATGMLAACTRPIERASQALSTTPSTSATTAATGPSSTPEPSVGGRPAIVVRTPRPGDEVVSPVEIAGTADVFEARVGIRILDAQGQELAATATTASCGTGCRGVFSAEVSFFVQVRQPGTIEVFEASAQDGAPLHLVSVDVVLVPGA